MAHGRQPLKRLVLVAFVAALLAISASPLFAAATTYTGVYAGGTITAGNSVVLNNGATVSGNVTVNGTMRFNQTGSLTLSSTLSGTGTLSLTSTGTLTLLATNTNSETTLPWAATIASGRLQIGSSGTGRLLMREILSVAGGTLVSSNARILPWGNGWNVPPPQPSAAATISSGSWINNGNLVVGAAESRSGVVAISESGYVAVGGTLSTGSVTYTNVEISPFPITTVGAINLRPGGTLQIGLGGTTGVLGLPAFATNGTLAFNRSDTATYAGAISGSGGVVQMGSGTMTLSGNNSYTGPTRVSAGLLILSGSNSSPLNVASGTVRLASGYAIPNVSATQSSQVGFTVANKATLSLDTGVFSEALIGTLASKGTGTSGFMNGSFLALDTSRASGGVFKLTRSIANTNSGSNVLGLVKTGSGALTLFGSNSYTGGTYIESGTLQIGSSIAIPGNVSNNSVLQNTSSDTVTMRSAISGSGTLVNLGNSLILSGSNTYTGQTLNYGELHLAFRQSLYGGDTSQWTASNITNYKRLRLSVGGAGEFTTSDIDILKTLGTGTTGFVEGSLLQLDTSNASSGTFVYAGSLANTNNGLTPLNLQKTGSGRLVLLGENTTSGLISASVYPAGGILQIGNGGTTGSVAGNISGALVFNRSNASVCSGSIFAYGNSGTAALTKLGNGTLTLTGSTQCEGDLVVGQGSIEVTGGGIINLPTIPIGRNTYIGRGAEGNATISLKGGSLLSWTIFIGYDGGQGTLNIASGTLAADGSYPGRDFANVYIDNGTINVTGGYVRGDIEVYRDESRLDISGGEVEANGYISRGAVVLRGGTFRGALELGRWGYASLLMSGGLVQSAKTLLGAWRQASGVATITGGTSIFTDLRIAESGIGRLTMTGGSVVSGSTVIGSGTGSLGQLILAGGTWSNSGNLVVGGSGTGLLTIGGGTSGDALLIVGQQMQRGAKGTIALDPGGTLQIGTGGTTGDLATDLTNNGLLVFNRSNAAIYSGILSGTGTLSQRGSGTLTLFGPNTLTGSTTIQQGTLHLAHASALANSTISPLPGASLTLTPNLQTTVGGLKPNAGGLIDIGTGQITVASGLSVADLATALQSGLGNGSWSGTSGIISSAAASSNGSRTVGWLDNGDGSLTVGYAAAGDTNLDWSVDILDLSRMLSAGKFNSDLSATWAEGDFTHDGVSDILDISRFISSGLFNAGLYNAPAGTIAAVPEPSTVGLVGVAVGVAGWMATRRKQAA